MRRYENPFSERQKRHEIKTLLTYPQYLELRQRALPLLTPDKHMSEPEGYRVQSVYLDDAFCSAYREKDGGVQHRNKFRIRAYNGSDRFLVLENKEKIDDRIMKTSLQITRADYDAVLSGDFSPLLAYDHPLARQVCALHAARLLRPAVIVEYEREAYVHPLSMVRITFDKRIAAGTNSLDMFDPRLVTRPIFDRQEVVLEIKYGEYFPLYLKQLLQNNGRKLAISKFVQCCDKLKAQYIILTPHGPSADLRQNGASHERLHNGN
ncbi:MAG: polyphosphate polymerase domain-containing protein [Lachnospiraceae bacterium]|nr:polyphosphate polymerase domain-containing protein [Lachnospiraceae bacterium]